MQIEIFDEWRFLVPLPKLNVVIIVGIVGDDIVVADKETGDESTFTRQAILRECVLHKRYGVFYGGKI